MALSPDNLKALIATELTSKGFVITGEHSKVLDMAEAISKAVVTHITSSAIVSTAVTTTGGSGTGTGAIT